MPHTKMTSESENESLRTSRRVWNESCHIFSSVTSHLRMSSVSRWERGAFGSFFVIKSRQSHISTMSCNALQRTATHSFIDHYFDFIESCHTQSHISAMSCNALQLTATHSFIDLYFDFIESCHTHSYTSAMSCNTPYNTRIYCNTLIYWVLIWFIESHHTQEQVQNTVSFMGLFCKRDL